MQQQCSSSKNSSSSSSNRTNNDEREADKHGSDYMFVVEFLHVDSFLVISISVFSCGFLIEPIIIRREDTYGCLRRLMIEAGAPRAPIRFPRPHGPRPHGSQMHPQDVSVTA